MMETSWLRCSVRHHWLYICTSASKVDMNFFVDPIHVGVDFWYCMLECFDRMGVVYPDSYCSYSSDTLASSPVSSLFLIVPIMSCSCLYPCYVWNGGWERPQ